MSSKLRGQAAAACFIMVCMIPVYGAFQLWHAHLTLAAPVPVTVEIPKYNDQPIMVGTTYNAALRFKAMSVDDLLKIVDPDQVITVLPRSEYKSSFRISVSYYAPVGSGWYYASRDLTPWGIEQAGVGWTREYDQAREVVVYTAKKNFMREDMLFMSSLAIICLLFAAFAGIVAFVPTEKSQPA